MAEIGNMINRNRMNLGEKVPLDTPLVIQLEASGVCNLECSFCPHGDANLRGLFPQEIMTPEMFQLFLKQAKEFPEKIKALRIIGLGEPLLNKDIAEFVKSAKESGSFENVEITTNGVALTKEMSTKLIDAGLDSLRVSLEALDAESFYKVAKRNINLDTMYENLEFFYNNRKECKLYIKITDIGLGDVSEEVFYEKYGRICDYICVEKVIENWPEFSAGAKGDAPMFDIEEYKEQKSICIQPFKLLCICANGDVVPCCSDWKRVLKVGNIAEESLKSIWMGDKLRNLQKHLLKMEQGGICKECMHPRLSQPDNIDDYRDEILKRMKR